MPLEVSTKLYFSRFSIFAVSDDLLQIIARNVGATWKDLAGHLLMTESDIQGIENLAYGKTRAAETPVDSDESNLETNQGPS